MDDSENQQPVDPHVNPNQQMTSKPPPKPKNPKRVAAGKLSAAKTKQAREAQKKSSYRGTEHHCK